ncbi:MAG: hypothetical protein F4089_03795 [Gammaproteobacteria bacterium]|nr:hypothetical protein [Gemmatimonadales bacterium]MYC87214.1 hypothetical protein [Candidatus Palauibacter denitrificans]MYJ74264.1 hypothetical protein [Gammaproteobacteria bacterium]
MLNRTKVSTGIVALALLVAAPLEACRWRVGHLGYATLRHPIAVNRGRTTQIDIGLVPAPVEMVPIVATGTRLRRLEIRGPHSHRRCLSPTGDEVGDERDEAASSAGAIRLDDLQLNVI